VAISLRGVAGVPDDVICDYPSLFYAQPPVAPDFSWEQAKRVAKVLRDQKRKGREIIGVALDLWTVRAVHAEPPWSEA
jgi:hypothetical protein